MLVYESTKEEFMTSVELGSICDEIYEVYQAKIGKSNKAQIRSWENSMEYMYKVLLSGLEINLLNSSLMPSTKREIISKDLE